MSSPFAHPRWLLRAIAWTGAPRGGFKWTSDARRKSQRKVQKVADRTKDPRQDHRHELLSVLFGPDVPSELEGQLLRTSEVARLFEVSERTVSEWAKRGQLPSVRTPGGHRRYPAEEILALLHRQEQLDRIGRPARPA